MSRIEQAWAAGFWDGEGSCSLRRDVTKTPRWCRLSISQKYSSECVLRFQTAVGGYGKVVTRDRQHPNAPGLTYQWGCIAQADIIEVMAAMWPFLSTPKKEQYLRCKAEQDRITEERKGWRSR